MLSLNLIYSNFLSSVLLIISCLFTLFSRVELKPELSLNSRRAEYDLGFRVSDLGYQSTSLCNNINLKNMIFIWYFIVKLWSIYSWMYSWKLFNPVLIKTNEGSWNEAITSPLFKLSILRLFIMKMTHRVKLLIFQFEKIIFIWWIHFQICWLFIL